MRLSQTSLCLALLFTTNVTGAFGQTALERLKAESAFGQALSLERQGKQAEAAAKMKEVVKYHPKNAAFAAYLAELEGMAGTDALSRHALAATAEHENTLDSLAEYLVRPARSDHDKARVIFRWIADRITYNVEGLLAGQLGDNTPEAVLRERKAVCQGYALLYEQLARRAGLEVVKVPGVAKGFLSDASGKGNNTSHAWNAVKINGAWQLLDSTWGAGAIEGKKFNKRYNEYFFLTPPAELVLTHLPKEEKWQLQEPVVQEADFEKWPRINSQLFRVGVSAAQLRTKLAEIDGGDIVEPLRFQGPRIAIEAAPLERKLRAGARFHFKVEATQFTKMVIVNAGTIQPLLRQGNFFEGQVRAKRGELMLAGKYVRRQNETFDGILRYVVE